MPKSAVERPMILRLSCLAFVASVTTVAACSAGTPDPSSARAPRRSFGLTLRPGPCVAGANVVSASAFVLGRGTESCDLTPRDGELRVTLVLDREPPRPGTLHWLEVPDAPEQTLPGPPWNLELTFDSPVAGDCPLHIEFQPTPQSIDQGLGAAVTTIVLKEAPPPPPPIGGP